MGLPKISLVTPCFNSEKYLKHTLDSITAQTGNFGIEHVVVDGGSTDGTLKILQQCGSQFTNIISEKDNGMYDALAKGFAQTTGEIMGWLNTDDVYTPRALETVCQIFSQLPNVEWISTLNPVAIDPAGDIFKIRTIAGFSRQAFLDGIYVGFNGLNNPYASDFIQQESTFWKRSLWERLGSDPFYYYRTDNKQAGDFGLWSMFAAEADLYGIEAPLGAWRMHSEQFTNEKDYMTEVELALSKLRKNTNYTEKKEQHEGFSQYTGKYIIKSSPKDPLSSWKTIEKEFYVLPTSDIKKAIKMGQIF
ncbi:glycosyltransferase [Gammaproteobacteria bacterium]|nr:glycosyltransferase [Gammaproteobacteria bacterium]